MDVHANQIPVCPKCARAWHTGGAVSYHRIPKQGYHRLPVTACRVCDLLLELQPDGSIETDRLAPKVRDCDQGKQ